MRINEKDRDSIQKSENWQVCANVSIFHSSSVNGSAASPYSKLHNLDLYTYSRLATVGFFDFCRRFLHYFLNLSAHVLQFSTRLLKLLIAFLLFVIRLNLYTRKQVRIIMSLPPTELIIYLHLKRVHFQMLLCKAADQLGPLGVSISLIIWLGDQRWKKVC